MHCASARVERLEAVRPKIEVADIVHRFGDELIETRVLNNEQRRALRAIGLCRTALLGGHVDVCPDCGHRRPAYNSCRNRHCPKCQWLASQRWLDSRVERMLPVNHFHVVFTLPSQLRPLVMLNRRLLFSVLFESATSALKTLSSDPKRLGAKLGITAVLHTWSRDLSFHPHIHCVVTAGGLGTNGQWVNSRKRFLFPVKPLGEVFRAVFLNRLKRLYADKKLVLLGKCASLASQSQFQAFIGKLYTKRFNVYSKKPFGAVRSVYQYLAKYTHRIAISNRRIIAFDDNRVTFHTRNGKTASFSPLGFLARFISHVLPRNFVRIRHYGLYSSSNLHTDLPRSRALLLSENATWQSQTQMPCDKPSVSSDEPDYLRRYRDATGLDLRLCPVCGAIMNHYKLVQDDIGLCSSPSRAPPEAA
jgi:hypothetical protein